MRCHDTTSLPSWETPTRLERRRWHRWERRVVATHEATLLSQLDRMAEGQSPVAVLDVAAEPVGVALLEVSGRWLILGGLNPRVLAGRPAGRLVGAGRYGPMWWLTMATPAERLTVAARRVRLVDDRGWDLGFSAVPPDSGAHELNFSA